MVDPHQHAPDAPALAMDGSHPLAERAELPLSARVAALAHAPAWREAFHALFNDELRDWAVGWPRLLSQEQLSRWLRAPDVLIELSRSPADEPFELGLVLHAETATQLVD